MTPTLRASVAIVTGGGGGVGRAVAARLARDGHAVGLLGRTADSLEVAAIALRAGGARVEAGVADVADRAAVESCLAGMRERLGPVDVLVNAAGIAEAAPLLPPDDALFDRAFSTNVRGAWVVSTACLPDMLAAGAGRIVNVASTAALVGYRYTAAYVASKHALLGLTRAMARDLEGKGVTVNAVCPGFLDTPMTARSIDRIVASTGRSRERALEDLLRSGHQERLIPPEEVADAVARLCGADGLDVTGSAIAV